MQYANYVVKGVGFSSLEKILNGNADEGIVFDSDYRQNPKVPNRDLFYDNNPLHRNNPIKNVISSIGCPYNCSYCYNSSYREIYPSFKVQLRPVEEVIEECAQLKKYPLRMIYFQDDFFGFNKEWLKEFSQEYRFKINIPFHLQLRLELTQDVERLQMIRNMHPNGGITIAIESANPEVRKKMLGRNTSDQLIYSGCEAIKRMGFKLRTEQMIGLPPLSDDPQESLENDLDLLQMNVKIRPDIAWCSIFAPYLGTSLGEYCVKRGLYSGTNEEISDSFFDNSALNFSNEHRERIKLLQRMFSTWAYLPKGDKLARKVLEATKGNCFSLNQMGEITRRHLYDELLYHLD